MGSSKHEESSSKSSSHKEDTVGYVANEFIEIATLGAVKNNAEPESKTESKGDKK